MSLPSLASHSYISAPTENPIQPPAHMPALDGLRGTAIVLVIACHAALTSRSSLRGATAHMVDLVMGAGWIGVDLFFVLSGFLITGILLATKESPTYYKSFFARRFLRIFPLYYLLVLLTVVTHLASFSRSDVVSLGFFYYNWQAVHLGHHLTDVNSLWSLAVEEQFYIVWPTTVLFCSERRLAQLSVVGMFIALILRLIILPQSTTFQSAYYLTPCRIDSLLVGALLAICHKHPEAWKRAQRLAPRTAVLSAITLLGIALWSGHFYDFVTKTDMNGLRHSSTAVLGPGCTLLAVLFGALLIKCTRQGPVFRIFNWQPLRRIGKYSYGMYMLHWPLLQIINKHILLRLGHLPFDEIGALAFVLILASSFAAAYVSFQLFEKHFLRLKRLFPAALAA